MNKDIWTNKISTEAYELTDQVIESIGPNSKRVFLITKDATFKYSPNMRNYYKVVFKKRKDASFAARILKKYYSGLKVIIKKEKIFEPYMKVYKTYELDRLSDIKFSKRMLKS